MITPPCTLNTGRAGGRGHDKHRLVRDRPLWSCPLILRYFRDPLVTLERHCVRVENARSTPTSRIRLRLSVLDRQPVLLRGVEASNRWRVRASSSDPALPLLPGARARVFPVFCLIGSTSNCAYTPSPLGCLCYTAQSSYFIGYGAQYAYSKQGGRNIRFGTLQRFCAPSSLRI